jgi:hypothetical protein
MGSKGTGFPKKAMITGGPEERKKPIIQLSIAIPGNAARRHLVWRFWQNKEFAKRKTMNMKLTDWFWRRILAASGLCTVLAISIALIPATPHTVTASSPFWWRGGRTCCPPFLGSGEEPPPDEELGGAWYWLRSPEQEKRVVMSLFTRYCIRCHGIDGRGVWDIPDVPNFTNARWQDTRTDGQLARAILEGRGAVMPPWRGTLSLEEAWAMARYVRTFGAGTPASRPDFSTPEKPASTPQPSTSPKTPPAK